MRNYGINIKKELSEQSEKDWIFGATSATCAASIPDVEVEKYLPKGEVQRGIEDTMDCATRSPLNKLETSLNYLLQNKKLGNNAVWLVDNGYVNDNGDVELSDAFIAILSGTTAQGNSLKAPIDAIRKYGFIPKSRLRLDPQMTQREYLNPTRVTDELLNLGRESIKRFPVNYDKVYDLSISDVCTAGFAWPEAVNGEYPSTNKSFNHAFWKFRNPKHYIFDNYEEAQGDFIKKLAPDYKLFDYGYRVYISTINELETESKGRSILDIIKEIWYSISNSLGF